MIIKSERLTPQQALKKLQHYCVWQERCHSEVAEKLFSYGIFKTDAAEIISKLIEENYLNEERFALHYAGGKFRIKHWGKIKIRQALLQKQVSGYCIKKALGSIDKAAYNATFYKLAEAKLKTLKGEKNIFTKKRKLQDHLLQKGFESALVMEFLRGI